jgi:putative PIG3 family NAD(P)H quinone oxidoreductase
MRALVIREAGGPEVLEVQERPAPEPSAGMVRVRVAFAGLNRADVMQRRGQYPAPKGVPADIPGLEYAGVVDAVGEGVSRWTPGDRVMGLVAGGACAELLVAHEREVVATPDALSTEEAAATPEAFVTAFDAIVVRGRLGAGDRLLVHAAGSGVGSAAVQIGRALGARVIGTSRTASKLDRCRDLGLAGGVVSADGKFAEAVRGLTGGEGVDVVLDLVGGDYVTESLRACAPRARVVLVGLTGGREARLDLGVILQKRLEIIGTVLRSRPLEEKIEAAQLLSRRLVPLLASGALRAVVDRTFPLAEAAEAHRYLESDASFGKVLLAL